MKKTIIILSMLSCASLPTSPTFREPWPGAERYQAIIICAASHEYGPKLAQEYALNVKVKVVPGLSLMARTDGNNTRIRAETTQVQKEALWRHEASHWLEWKRTGRWTYYPACSAKSEHPNKEFLDWENRLRDAFNICRREAEGQR